MEFALTIGKWIEQKQREITQCPSYYAADWERLRLRPGEYDLSLVFVSGYVIPMPYWLRATVKADRIDGATYSGFGGVNFASRPLEKCEVDYHINAYDYQLNNIVKNGRARVEPGFEWTLTDRLGDKYPKTWEELRLRALPHKEIQNP